MDETYRLLALDASSITILDSYLSKRHSSVLEKAL